MEGEVNLQEEGASENVGTFHFWTDVSNWGIYLYFMGREDVTITTLRDVIEVEHVACIGAVHQCKLYTYTRVYTSSILSYNELTSSTLHKSPRTFRFPIFSHLFTRVLPIAIRLGQGHRFTNRMYCANAN